MSSHREFASCEHVRIFSLSAMVLFAFFIVSVAQIALGQDVGMTAHSDAKESAQEPATEKAVQSALATRIDFDFRETPLKNVADNLSKASGVNIELDTRELDDLGYDGRSKASLRARGISIRAGLHHLLRNLDLTWHIRGRTVMITSHEAVEADLDTRFYHVSDLASTDGDLTPLDTNTLIDLIESTIEPHNWNVVGGPGAVTAFDEFLVVSCTQKTHVQIEGALASLRQLARAYEENPVDGPVEPTTLSSTPADEAVRAALDSKTISVDLKDIPLDDAADTISRLSGIPVVIDRIALEDVGLYAEPQPKFKGDEDVNPFGEGDDPFGASAEPAPMREPEANPFDTDPFGALPMQQHVWFCTVRRAPMVSCVVEDATLHEALDLMLRPLDLAWIVRDEAVVITTPEESECELLTRIYPARDLVVDDDGLSSPDTNEALAEIVTGVHPETWDVVGGPGSVEALDGLPLLIVSQTEEVHAKVARTLAGLRRALKSQKANTEQTDRANGDEEDRVVMRVYHVVFSPAAGWPHKAPGPAIDELVAITRDLVAPQTWNKEAGRTIHKLGDAVVIRSRPTVHQEFTKLLKKLGVRWHTTLGRSLRHPHGTTIPVVGGAPEHSGGMFNVQDH